MANGGRIDYTIGFNVDKSGLADLKNELNTLQKMSPSDLLKLNPNIKDINEARSAIMKLQPDIIKIQESFKHAFDSTTGITNITRLQKSLQSMDLAKMQKNFSALGPAGNKAFNQIAARAMTTNLQFKETNNLLDKMSTTFGNTLKWGISSSIMNTFTGAIQQAYGYVQHLDTSLNDIRIVTGKSADEMDRFAAKANDAAKSLGASTTDYTEAALIYRQQGLGDEETEARTETTLKAANVTGQTGREVSEQLTAVWNGYKVTAEETELYVDKLAAVAASTAADLEELSTGMSKVASAANNMGVDIDQLNAQLATIVSVTRQAPETAGTALKTIYARMEDLKISGEDEEGVKLGEVSSTLEEVGVQVMDTSGDLRDLGEVIEEVASKWDTWTGAQQNAIAQALAGKRQYNNLLALFDNWDMYTEALETSRNAAGTLQKQQDIYMESTAAHLQQLKTQWEDLYDSLFDTDSINSVVDLLTGGLDKVTNFVDAIGGGKGALFGLGAVATNVFNKQISQGLESIITKFSNAKENAKQLEAELAIVRQYGEQVGLRSSAIEEIVELKEYTQQYYDVMSQEEIQAHNDLIQHAADQAVIKQNWEDNAKAYQEYVQGLVKGQAENSKNRTFSAPTTDSQGNKVYKGQAEKAMNVDVINNEGIEESTKAIDNAIKAAEKLKVTQNEATEAIRKYQEVIKDSSSSQAKVSKAANEMQKALQNLSDAEDNLAQEANLTEKENDELGLSFNKTNEKLRSYIKTYTDATKVSSRGGASNALNAALNQQSDLINKITSETINSANTQKEKVGEIQQKYKEANDALQAYKESIKATGQFDTRQLVSGITSFISGVSSIGFAFQSLSSLTKTWADETTSTFDKVTQTMISLGMVIPGITNVFKGLNAAKSIYNVLTGQQVLANGALYSSELVQLSALAMEEKELEKIAIQNGLTLEEIQAKIAAKDRETLSLIANTEAWEKNRRAQGLEGQSVSTGEQGLMKGLPKLKDKVLGLKESLTSGASAVGGFVQSTTGIGVASEAAVVGIAALGTAIAAVAAGVAIGVIAYKNWKANLEETAAAAEQAAKQAKETTEKLKEQKDVVNQVTEEYKQLNEQYDETQIKEYRQSVYELCKQHNLQSLAVQALAADYEELGKIMDEASQKANESYNESIKAEQATIQKSVSAGIWRDIKHSERDSNLQGEETIDLKGFDGILSKRDKELKADLEKLGGVFVDQGHITLESFTDLATNNYEALTKVLNESATPAAKRLLEIINAQSDALTRYQEISNEQKGALIDTKYGDEVQGIQSAQQYDQVRTKMQNDQEIQNLFKDVNGLVDQEAVNEFVQSYLNGIDTIKQYAQASDYADVLMPKFNLDKAQIESQLSKLTDAEQQFVVDNADLAGLYDNIEDFIDAYHDIIGRENDNQQILNVGIALTNADGTAFKPEDLDNLFANKDFEINLGKSREEFESETYEQQVADLTQYYLKANQLENDFQNNKKAKIQEEQQARADDLEKQKTELENIGKDITEQYGVAEEDLFIGIYNNYKTQLDTVMSDIDQQVGFDFISEDSLEILEKAIDPAQELNDYEAEYIRQLKEKYNYDDQDLQLMYAKIKANEEYQQKLQDSGLDDEIKNTKSYNKALSLLGNRLSQTTKILDKLGDAEIDWSAYKKGVDDLKKSTNSAIDSLQGAYNSLNSVMDEYNSTQVLSMDNLQTLLDMDTAYLSALQIENGQMTLNEESLKQIALAKLDEAEAEAYAQAMEELHNEETRQAILGQQQAVISLNSLGGAAVTAAEAARSGVDAWREYWDAALNREGVANDAYAQQVGQGLQNKLQAIDQVRQQIMSGGFKQTMQGPEKASSASSSESKKEAQHEEYLERERDIYRQINEELEQIESTLGRIQKQNSYKWGKDLQKGLQQENKLLDKQLDKLKQKAKLQKADLGQRRATLEKEGIKFSKDGSTMKNAEDKIDKLYKEYNSMVDKYNSMSADQQENYKKSLDAKKKDIDKIEKSLSDYESLFSDYQSTLDEILDKHYEQIENNVEKFNNMVDVHLELDEARKEWDDFWYEVIEDVDDTDFGGMLAKSMSKLKTLIGVGGDAQNSQIAVLTEHLNKTVDEVQAQIDSRKRGGEDSLFQDATKLSKENLEKYRDSLMEAVREAKEELDNMSDNYLKTLASAQELIDKQIDGLESINDHLEHNVELIKLVSGEEAYEPIIQQYEKIYQNNLKMLDTQKKSKDTWAANIDKYTELLKTTEKGTLLYKTYEKSLEESTENYKKAVSDLDKSLEKTLKDLQAKNDAQISSIRSILDKNLSKQMGLESMEHEWNLINEDADRYLDSVEKSIELQLYANDLNDAAEATGLTAANQQRLNQFRDDELKKLREKERLTQYDIDESRARLEILKQEMALEDQRNNKSNMRLRRDSQGNYNYQYVGDAEAEEEAEEGLLTAKKAWYELVKKRNIETTKEIIEIRKQIVDEWNQYQKTGDEQYLENYRMLVKQHNDLMVEAKKAATDMTDGVALYFSDVMTNDILPQNKAAAREMILMWDDKSKESFLGATEQAITDLRTVQEQFKQDTTDALKAAGVSYKEDLIEGGIDPTLDKLEDMIMTNEELDEALKEVNDSLGEQATALGEAEDAYNNLKDAAVEALEEANRALEELSQTAIETKNNVIAAVQATSAAAAAQQQLQNAANSVGANTGGGTGGGGTTSGKKYRYTITAGTQGRQSYVNIIEVGTNKRVDGIDKSTASQSQIDAMRKKYNLNFKSGGYTGNWNGPGLDGIGGRMAVLHQKELVLNESDTSNLLKAVSILRSLASVTSDFSGLADSLVSSSMMWRQQMLNQSITSGTAIPQSFSTTSTNDYKNFVVNADFSGVRSADEIYQALLELENYGVQQAYSSAPIANRSY